MARTALYRHFDANNRLLYVGISDCLSERDRQHTATAHWHNAVARSEVQWCLNREHAAALEAVAIRFEMPLHNVALARPMEAVGKVSPAITKGHQRLNAFFAATGVKHVWLAEKLGISRSYVSELCSGKKRPGRDLAFKIQDVTRGSVRASAWLEAA